MNFLKQKKAGLPIWAWAAIAATLIFGLFIIMRKRGGGSSSNAAPSDAGVSSTDPGTGFQATDGGGGSGSFDPFSSADQPSDYVIGSAGGGTDFPNVTDATAPQPTPTSGPSTSSPTKPTKAAVKSTSTRYAQTGSTLGSTTALRTASGNARVQRASASALKKAKKQGKNPATAALAARSAGLNAAYFRPKPAKKKTKKKVKVHR